MKEIIKVWFIVFILWTLYRILFKLPEAADELIAKPIIFILLPFALLKVKTIPGLAGYQSIPGLAGYRLVPGFENKKNIFEDILIGIASGFIFAFSAFIANRIKYGSFSFDPLLPLFGFWIFIYLALSLATSISEEILGRGFLFGEIKKQKGVFKAAIISSFLMLVLHLPVLLLVLHLTGITLVVYLSTVFLLSIVNCYLYENRGSLVLPIFVHLFWNMTVALYL